HLPLYSDGWVGQSWRISLLQARAASACPYAMHAKPPKRKWRGELQFFGGNDLHRLQRDVLHHGAVAGGDLGDLVDHVHAAHDLGEYGIAEVAAAVVEEVIVAVVDEELAGGRVDVLGASHRDGTAYVVQPVVG